MKLQVGTQITRRSTPEEEKAFTDYKDLSISPTEHPGMIATIENGQYQVLHYGMKDGIVCLLVNTLDEFLADGEIISKRLMTSDELKKMRKHMDEIMVTMKDILISQAKVEARDNLLLIAKQILSEHDVEYQRIVNYFTKNELNDEQLDMMIEGNYLDALKSLKL